ncbi:DJ-1/PfpI family protein [Candidatus Izemoplasma sp. B36]|uniref:DJ-1/PfpI family protein n=1 Tax=Candidatus Izemoplasma sp. B36 TaxID=3242468 RepID=UPI0035565526
MKFLCVIADGFEDMEALGTIALLRRAGIEVEIASVFNKRTVIGSKGIKVIPDLPMKKVDESNYHGLFIPGGGHAFILRETESVKKLVSKFYENKKWLMAICAAPTVFGMMGIMDNRKYISFPGTEKEMGKAKRMNDLKVVRDGIFITARSVGTVYDFVFEIIRTVFNEKAVEKLKKNMVY